jgi:KUP system potassium uptake protein
VPFVNWALMLGTIFMVVAFKKSGNLAEAYGIAVSADMLITSCLLVFVARRIWKAKLVVLIPLAILFISVDLAFFSSNIIKVVSGGWIVVLFATVLALVMKTWRDGRARIHAKMEKILMSIDLFSQSLDYEEPVRVNGTAVYLASNPSAVPVALLHNLKHNMVLHRPTVIVCVQNLEVPYVLPAERAVVTKHGHDVWQILLRYGFTESPDIPHTLQSLKIQELSFEHQKTTYFVGRETLVLSKSGKRGALAMSIWRKKIFWFLSHNAQDATSFFRLPSNRVIEIGMQTEL